MKINKIILLAFMLIYSQVAKLLNCIFRRTD